MKLYKLTPHSFRWIVSGVLGMSFFGLGLGVAQGAPLNYSAATTIQLTSPSIQFTIAAGSEANSLVVNAGSVVVVVPVGSNFTLTSASRDLSVAEGVTSQSSLSCAGGVATLTIGSGNTSIQTATITPTSAQCSAAAAPVSPGSGGGGGGSGFGGGGGGGGGYVPPPTPQPTSTPGASVITPQARLDALQAQLQQLQQSQSRAVRFGKDLGIGSTGSDVKLLQQFLISQSKGPATIALQKAGTTGTFGPVTKSALAEYQRSVGINPIGYLGPLTRKQIDAGVVAPQPVSTSPIVSQPPTTPPQISATNLIFTRNLGVGTRGSDVKALQGFLISKNVGLSAKALTDALGETGPNGTFGSLTAKALAEYQASVGISATGYLGPLTRKQIQGQ